MTPVYHHTDTMRLPWIFVERQLCPSRGAFEDYPRPTFLWATTDECGDRTAALASKEGRMAWRRGWTQIVRFILAGEDFEPWPDICKRFPQWTPQYINRLERSGRAKGASPERWLCRTEPLSPERWLGVETRSYNGLGSRSNSRRTLRQRYDLVRSSPS
jgi:hypothetical protein